MAVIEWVDRAAKAEEPAAEAPAETAAAAE
jgi:hypothetical protein